MAKKKDRSLLVQKIAVGVAAAIIVGLFGYFYSRVLTEAPHGEFVEGEHYTLVDNPRRIHGDKVQVMEFFSYACPHCYSFDPKLNEWVEQNKAHIDFVRTPAVGSNLWRMYAKTYYAMQALGILGTDHEKLFNAIHGIGQNLDSVDSLAAWFAQNGTTDAAFRSMFDAEGVNENVESADELARRYKIASVPSIVINGKYLVVATQEIGPSRMLDVMDYLVKKEEANSMTDTQAPTK